MEKRIILLAIVVVAVCLCSSAFALDPMGPPIAGLKQGELSYGAEWSYSDMEVKRMVQAWSSADDQMNIKMHKGYANIGYGVADNWEGFLRLGGAYIEWDRDAQGYRNYSHDPLSIALGGGFKTTVYEQAPDCHWGVLGQVSWADFAGVAKREDTDSHNWQMELIEWQFAVGPTWQMQDGVVIYGGPFLYYAGGRISERGDNTKGHKPIEELSTLGGYIGAQFEIAEDICASLEWQHTGVADAICGCLVWRQ